MNITKDCIIECNVLNDFILTPLPLKVIVVNEDYIEDNMGKSYHKFEVKVLEHKSDNHNNEFFPVGAIREIRASDLYKGTIVEYPDNYLELIEEKQERKRKLYEKQYPVLTSTLFNENIGKEIIWHSYGYHRNLPYKGICKLIGLQEIDGKVRPVIEHIKGDDLSCGWLENNYFTFSDSHRPVRIGGSFDLYDVKWDVPTFSFYRSTGNPMTYSIMVRNGEDVNSIARKATTAIEFEIQHIV